VSLSRGLLGHLNRALETMHKIELRPNQVYRLERRQGPLRKVPLLLRKLLHKRR